MYNYSPDYVPLIKGSILGQSFNFPMDTGSTGFLIGAPRLPQIPKTKGTPAWEFLDSSGLLYNGRLVDLTVTFQGAGGQTAASYVPVLIVDTSLHCPWYNATSGNGTCPPDPTRKPTVKSVAGITYMGMGWGRDTPGSGLPDAIPSHNPFLNVVRIGSRKITPGSLSTGYVVTKKGAWLGLTATNTAKCKWTQLKKGYTSDPRDWAGVGMAFKIDGVQGVNSGSALFDTGIPQMFLRAAPGVAIPKIMIKNPGTPPPEYVPRVKPGTKLSFAFPSFGAGQVAAYNITIGVASPMAPAYAFPEYAGPGSSPFVNTGRDFFFGYSVAFDAVNGRCGFCPVPSS